MKGYPAIIAITILRDGRPTARKIDAVRFGAFAAHDSEDEREGWVVSHVASGLALPTRVIGEGLSKDEACTVAAHLSVRWGNGDIIATEDSRISDRYPFEALVAEAFDPEVTRAA